MIDRKYVYIWVITYIAPTLSYREGNELQKPYVSIIANYVCVIKQKLLFGYDFLKSSDLR